MNTDEYSLEDIAAKNPNIVLTDQTDLTDEQIVETRETYLRFAENYVRNYERKNGVEEIIQSKHLVPFLEMYRKSKLHGPILFVGCGSGRDLQKAKREGFACSGIDISPALLALAKELGVDAPLHEMDLFDLEFDDNSFSALFCDTALNHNRKADLPRALEEFKRVVEPRGIGYFGFRRGDGRVYYTDDAVGGRRFNISMTMKEVTGLLESEGLEILSIGPRDIPNAPQIILVFARFPVAD